MTAKQVTHHLHKNDLEYDVDFGDSVAIDTEAMGLNNLRDRLCLIQLSAGDGTVHLVQMTQGSDYHAPRLKKLLEDPKVIKIFHYARFDVAILQHYLGANIAPLYCTKIASKLSRTYTDRHSLKALCQALLGVTLDKESQASDWGHPDLTEKQLAYAASDVLYLHQLKRVLDELLERDGRLELAHRCFQVIPTYATLELSLFNPTELFSH